MLGDRRLHEDRRPRGVDAAREPVGHHFEDVGRESFGAVVVGGEGMPVGDEEEAFVCRLQLAPVVQRTEKVAEVQTSRRTHAAHDASRGRRHRSTRVTKWIGVPTRNRNQPDMISAARIKKPNGSMAATIRACGYGRSPVSTRPPSSGGSGSKLKIARTDVDDDASLAPSGASGRHDLDA